MPSLMQRATRIFFNFESRKAKPLDTSTIEARLASLAGGQFCNAEMIGILRAELITLSADFTALKRKHEQLAAEFKQLAAEFEKEKSGA